VREAADNPQVSRNDIYRSIVDRNNNKARRFMFAPSFDYDALAGNIVERLAGTSRAIKLKFEIVAECQRWDRGGRWYGVLCRYVQRQALAMSFRIPELAPSLPPRGADHPFSSLPPIHFLDSFRRQRTLRHKIEH
jgi:hypothetical protein